MLILAAQINPIIGDLKGNLSKIIEAIGQGKKQGVELVVFPEMALSGYPPEDFILLPHFMQAVEKSLEKIVQAAEGIAVIIGIPRNQQPFLMNSAALINNQKLEGFADKILLPTYDVFDERRYFEPGEKVKIWHLNGKSIAITICEDIWQHSGYLTSKHYACDPLLEIKAQNPDLLINVSASPYSYHKFETRLNVVKKASQFLQCPVLLCNQVGGNDSLIFDGYSLYANQNDLLALSKGFEADELVIDTLAKSPISFKRDPVEHLYKALVLGLKDYFAKLGFERSCLGLSGGIDSAVVACLAQEALGNNNVLAITMPSRYSSPESTRDAKALAKALKIECKEISIEEPFESYLHVLKPHFAGKTPDITEENLQARIRGMLLMAFANKFGYLALATSNKSETALGYATLYGDMCGGLSVIGDITKTQVYALAKWINREKEIIPAHTMERPPSAELRPNQKDTDSLPEYDIIDVVLKAYVEDHHSPLSIAENHQFSIELVEDIVRRIHRNEYKRRQAPPSLRVSEKAFSVGRRFPIVQRWV